VKSALYPAGNLSGTGGGALVCTNLFLSSVGSKSVYLMGIGSTGVLGAWFCVLSYWGACCWSSRMHNGWRRCWVGCMHRGWGFRCTSGWSCVTVNEDTTSANLSTLAWRVVTSSRSSWTSCLSWSIFYVCTSVCMCELKLKEDIRPLYRWIDLLWKRKFV